MRKLSLLGVCLILWMVSAGAAEPGAQQSSIQEAAQLQDEAQKLHERGRYQDGIEAAQRALAIREELLGVEHPEVAVSLQTLGRLYLETGRYELAESTQQRALALREKVLGPEHPDTAKSLVSLARLYLFINNYSKAEILFQRALALCEKTLGAEHVETSRALSGLASVYTQMAAYERAVPLFERALAIRERAADAESAEAVFLLNNFGNLYRRMGAYAQAKKLYQRAAAMSERVQGPEHPVTVALLSNLGLLHSNTGNYVEAEAMYKRALAIRERTLGIRHPQSAVILSNLAVLYAYTGAYDRAETLFRRAISIQTEAQAAGKEDLALSLNNLADMYLDMGHHLQAEPLCRQALEIAEKLLGTDHPLTAAVLGNLGGVYHRMGDYQRAESLIKQSLAVSEAANGSEHRVTADLLYGLADVHYDSGAPLKAQPLYLRAIAIYEKALGPEHPELVQPLRSLALTHWARGETQQALSLLQRVQRIRAKNTERFLLMGSEARKREYQRFVAGDTFVEVAFSIARPGRAATVLGLTSVLQHKGRVLDAVSDNLTRIRRSLAPRDRASLEQLAQVTNQLSALTYGSSGSLSSEQHRSLLAQLTAQQEQLESELAGRSRAFSRELVPVTLANVRRAIPANAVLVEWFRYAAIDPTQRGTRARQGSSRYVAYVLKRTGDPVTVDVGAAHTIEALVRRLRVALSDSASTDVKQHAAALSEQLLGPLRAHLHGMEHIVFSPDGALNLVPMAALLDETRQYLAERFNVSYVTSGRDLLRLAAEPKAASEAVVFADPDYGKQTATPARDNPMLQPRRSPELDRGGLFFRPLENVALEARSLQALLKLDDARVLMRLNATEAKLKRLRQPRILHIASHGFFLSDQQLAAEMTQRFGARPAPVTSSENPLLRSGIALAGANARKSSANDDGILTALEATQLDLRGTELVVLSACDSGMGEVQNGEGVYGLRRALAIAGAQTQVSSLWKVSDEATRILMVDYYERLLQGEGRSEALRRAQRAMLGNSRFSHPYYWASFIPIGDWTVMPSLRAKQGAVN
jgi:CHAT domain-containing protein/Tfp pilus assembly protein PilF